MKTNTTKSYVAIFACFMAIIILSLLFCGTGVVAEAQTIKSDYKTSKTYLMLDDFVAKNPNRVGSSVGEREAKDYLVNQLYGFGFTSQQVNAVAIDDSASYNVVAMLNNSFGNEDIIVIGAHYDTVANSAGVYDNASGVVALLQIAEILLENQDSLMYDVMLVFFGSEEYQEGYYLRGSSDFVSKMGYSRNNIKLFVNIDSISGGDNLYIFSEEKVTNYQKAFVTASANSSAVLQNKPLGKGVYSGFDYFGYGYYQVAQMSDFSSFRSRGIPSVMFFSGTYDTLGWNYAESTDKEFCVMNSTKDTMEIFNKRGQDAVDKIDTVVASVTKAILEQTNYDTFVNAESELVSRIWFNRLYASIAGVAFLLLMLLLIMLYHKKLVKNSLLGTAEVKNTKIFNSPNADDIFDLDGSGEKEDKTQNSKTDDDFDDIFKF